MTTPERLSIDANGLTFGALGWGELGAPLALLVHGYPDTAWTWRHLGPFLAERGWRVVAPFTRGYAPSDLAPNDRYLAADLAQDILALHTALGGDDRSVLVGHDWGAVATYAVTAAEPERFCKYVTLAVPPTPGVLKPLTSTRTLGIAGRQLRMSWYFLYNQLPGSERGLDKVIQKHWRDWSPGYDAGEDLAHVFESLSGPGRRRAALRYYRNNLQGGLKALFTMKANAPVLYLHGERDGCMQAEIISRFPETLPKGSRYDRVPGVGHFLQLEQPDRINDLIHEWIGEPRVS
jgi:pimeloyl-ACP methyl ester carboxylesterase